MPRPPMPIEGFQKQRFLAWLCTPIKERDPKTMEELADELGVSRQSLTNWKTKDKDFMEEWEKLYLKTIGNPEPKMEIMKTLYRTATDNDDPKHVQAAKAYFEIEGSLKPVKTQITVEQRDTKSLTLEEIEDLLAGKAQKEADVRQLRVVGEDDD